MHIVFGGSFNPPTKAHVQIIKYLCAVFPSSKVIIVPVGDDYRKPELAPFHMRFDMLKLAVNDLDRVILSPIESNQGYQGTLRTLDDLSKTYQDIHFVIGSDHLKGLRAWIKYEELLRRYPFIVINRRGYLSQEEAEAMYKDVEHRFIYLPFDDISASTLIRKNKHQFKDMLDPNVYEYILKHQLYEVNTHV
jgi:nicotinate-nucleotide adenylyltransferase